LFWSYPQGALNRAEHYREQAEMAKTAPTGRIRDELLALAVQYERLADSVLIARK
jgi:hypothetical protein